MNKQILLAKNARKQTQQPKYTCRKLPTRDNKSKSAPTIHPAQNWQHPIQQLANYPYPKKTLLDQNVQHSSQIFAQNSVTSRQF